MGKNEDDEIELDDDEDKIIRTNVSIRVEEYLYLKSKKLRATNVLQEKISEMRTQDYIRQQKEKMLGEKSGN